ncbi:hypothetical protein EVAR_99307_1 [Eumeta japonica]|uniref:Uncharacterized protein n=1 Tax=Eumeta variegata TaxID=151549 RepID=A0A4C1YZM6_EUMVA|nr:hypothetical protein EVAR_99307_1 [Eumeta japonica]
MNALQRRGAEGYPPFRLVQAFLVETRHRAFNLKSNFKYREPSQRFWCTTVHNSVLEFRWPTRPSSPSIEPIPIIRHRGPCQEAGNTALTSLGMRLSMEGIAVNFGSGNVLNLNPGHTLDSSLDPTLSFNPGPILNFVSGSGSRFWSRLVFDSDASHGSNLYEARTNNSFKTKYSLNYYGMV